MDATSNSSPGGAQAFRYPSVDPGIPALDVEALLAAHEELIDRIKVCFGMDCAAFEQTIAPLLHRYANYVHLLPCTPDNYFNEPGGMLRIGLETAFFALQGTDAHIFSGRATITERRHLEPRWQLATFIGGLCCELHRPLSYVIVTDEAGNEWSPYLLPLSDWLREHKIERYFLKWRPHASESCSLGLFALPHVVSAQALQDLAIGNTQIVPHLLATIAGQPVYRDHNVLETLVRRALALVIDRFLQTSAERYGKPQLGSHLERYLVDALRRLVAANGNWTPNADKSRVWFGADGMFIVWPSAADDIRKLLEADQLPGIPKAPETILEILLTAGVLATQEGGNATWRIRPPGSKGALDAVKLTAPVVLYAESDNLPQALAETLLTPSPSAPSTAAGHSATVAPNPPSAHLSPTHQTSSKTIGKRYQPTGAVSDVEPPSEQPFPPHAAQLSPLACPSAPPPEGLSTTYPGVPTRSNTDSSSPTGTRSPHLLAPLRLSMIVKEALAAILAPLPDTEAEWTACLMDDGLFVPLAAFSAHKVAAPAAVRALGEVGMLAQPSSLTRVVEGREVIGLLIDKKYVGGLPTFPGEAH